MNRRPYRLLARRIIRYWPQFLQLGALTAIASFTAALTPWPIKLFADNAVGSEPPPGWLIKGLDTFGLAADPQTLAIVAAVALFLILVISALPDLFLSRHWAHTGESLTRDLSVDLLAKRLRFPMNQHVVEPVGDSMLKINFDSYSIYTLADLLLIAPARELMTLLAMAVLAFSLSPLLTMVAFVLVPILVVVAEMFGRRVRIAAERKRKLEGRFAETIQRSLASLVVIQALNLSIPSDRFRRLASIGVGIARRDDRARLLFDAISGSVVLVSTGLILFVGARLVSAGDLTIGGLLVFLGYMASIRVAVVSLLGLWRSRQEIHPSVDRITRLLESDEVHEWVDAKPLVMRASGARIEFDRVNFGHDGGPPILQDISFSVEPGELVCIVGPTGSGKSTLLSLIPRLFEPSSGRVLINGQDVSDVSLDSLRSSVAMVLQEPFLFPVSIAENIAYGRPDATWAEVQDALVVAGAADFVARLPEGMDTIIGEKGATLSGGERQRLSIARALLRDSLIVLLDEPTSALDVGTENDVMDAIERLTQGRTTLMVTHRESTIDRADRILEVQGNTIHERVRQRA